MPSSLPIKKFTVTFLRMQYAPCKRPSGYGWCPHPEEGTVRQFLAALFPSTSAPILAIVLGKYKRVAYTMRSPPACSPASAADSACAKSLGGWVAPCGVSARRPFSAIAGRTAGVQATPTSTASCGTTAADAGAKRSDMNDSPSRLDLYVSEAGQRSEVRARDNDGRGGA